MGLFPGKSIIQMYVEYSQSSSEVSLTIILVAAEPKGHVCAETSYRTFVVQ